MCFCSTTRPVPGGRRHPPSSRPMPSSCVSTTCCLAARGERQAGAFPSAALRKCARLPRQLRSLQAMATVPFCWRFLVSLVAMGVFKVLLPSLKSALKFRLISPISKGAVLLSSCCFADVPQVILCRASPPKPRTLFLKDSVHNYYQLFISLVVKEPLFFSL